MFNRTSISHNLLIIVVCFSLSIVSACSQNPNASKITLVPEPFWESGIYSLDGLDSGGGLIWSPDGKYLAGLIEELPMPDCPPSPIFCIFDDPPHTEIFIVDTNYWKRQTVLKTDYGEKDIYSISWFPDSQQIMYGASSQLWSIDVDGQNDRLFLDEDGRPFLSPDGSKIALTSSINGPGGRYSEIYLINVSSGQKEMIFKGPDPKMYIFDLTWSPDGKILAFSYGIIDSNLIKKPDIFFLDLETHKVTQVTNDEFQYRSIHFSPKAI